MAPLMQRSFTGSARSSINDATTSSVQCPVCQNGGTQKKTTADKPTYYLECCDCSTASDGFGGIDCSVPAQNYTTLLITFYDYTTKDPISTTTPGLLVDNPDLDAEPLYIPISKSSWSTDNRLASIREGLGLSRTSPLVEAGPQLVMRTKSSDTTPASEASLADEGTGTTITDVNETPVVHYLYNVKVLGAANERLSEKFLQDVMGAKAGGSSVIPNWVNSSAWVKSIDYDGHDVAPVGKYSDASFGSKVKYIGYTLIPVLLLPIIEFLHFWWFHTRPDTKKKQENEGILKKYRKEQQEQQQIQQGQRDGTIPLHRGTENNMNPSTSPPPIRNNASPLRNNANPAVPVRGARRGMGPKEDSFDELM